MRGAKKSSIKHKQSSIIDKYINEHPLPLVRLEPSRKLKEKFLIYCEGKNTEPSYFKQFKLATAIIESFGEGKNTKSLVEKAIEIKSGGSYDQVWCVFDKDDHDLGNFNDAIKLAESNGIGVAYSVQAFEYWLILHFDDHQRGKMHRNQYNDKINAMINPLGADYDGHGTKLISDSFFDLLRGNDPKTNKGRTELACERAKRNYDLFDHRSPGTEESSTTVFQLVVEILKFV